MEVGIQQKTIGRVIAGAVADQILEKYNIEIIAFVSQVGSTSLDIFPDNISRDMVDNTITRFQMNQFQKKWKKIFSIKIKWRFNWR